MDVTGLGLSTANEDEEQKASDSEEIEVDTTDEFWETWDFVGQALLEESDPADLAVFLSEAFRAAAFDIIITAYPRDTEMEGISLTLAFEVEDEPEDEEALDDLEGSSDCGDFDEE